MSNNRTLSVGYFRNSKSDCYLGGGMSYAERLCSATEKVALETEKQRKVLEEIRDRQSRMLDLMGGTVEGEQKGYLEMIAVREKDLTIVLNQVANGITAITQMVLPEELQYTVVSNKDKGTKIDVSI